MKAIPKGVRLINIRKADDARGSLCFAENSELPFNTERVFWIYGVGEGKTRGGHAHTSCAEIVFPVAGSFDMWTDDGNVQQTYHMNKPNEGIYIGPGTWCELRNFAPGTVCVVLASEPYKADGYINDYKEFKSAFAR